MDEQLVRDVIGGIALIFVIPTLVWVLLRIRDINVEIAVIEREMKIRTEESARRHEETSEKFDKMDTTLLRIEQTLIDLRERFSDHNGWERHRAAIQNGKRKDDE